MLRQIFLKNHFLFILICFQKGIEVVLLLSYEATFQQKGTWLSRRVLRYKSTVGTMANWLKEETFLSGVNVAGFPHTRQCLDLVLLVDVLKSA